MGIILFNRIIHLYHFISYIIKNLVILYNLCKFRKNYYFSKNCIYNHIYYTIYFNSINNIHRDIYIINIKNPINFIKETILYLIIEGNQNIQQHYPCRINNFLKAIYIINKKQNINKKLILKKKIR
jgi:hypothetical protein